jgi:glycosyltransferase involved in cell wall biosynthesis
MFISVIIPTLNSAKTIQNTLRGIFSNNFPQELFEVIVVDNGSSDATEKAVKSFPVSFLKCPKRGQGPARNLGLRNAKGNIICFTDSDILIPKDWLAKMSDFLQKNPTVDAVGGIVLPPKEENRSSIRCIAGEIYVERQGFPSVLTRTQYLKYQGSLYTANSAYRKETLDACNGFDESLWNHYYYHDSCDIDLSWRLVNMGKNLLFTPDIKVYHYAQSNLQGIFRQLFGWGAVYTMIRKKYGWHGSLRERLWLFHYFVNSFLSIVTAPLSKPRKRLLKIFYVSSFNLGRLVGYRRWKMERVANEIRANQGISKAARAELN